MRRRLLRLLAPVTIAARDIEHSVAAECQARAEARVGRALPAATPVLPGHRGAVPVLGDEDVLDARERGAAVETGARDGQRRQRFILHIWFRVREVDELVA